jgi:hypothetical protein
VTVPAHPGGSDSFDVAFVFTMVRYVLPGPSLTGRTATLPGGGRPVYSSAQPMQALAIVRSTGAAEKKKPLLRDTGFRLGCHNMVGLVALPCALTKPAPSIRVRFALPVLLPASTPTGACIVAHLVPPSIV